MQPKIDYCQFFLCNVLWTFVEYERHEFAPYSRTTWIATVLACGGHCWHIDSWNSFMKNNSRVTVLFGACELSSVSKLSSIPDYSGLPHSYYRHSPMIISHCNSCRRWSHRCGDLFVIKELTGSWLVQHFFNFFDYRKLKTRLEAFVCIFVKMDSCHGRSLHSFNTILLMCKHFEMRLTATWG